MKMENAFKKIALNGSTEKSHYRKRVQRDWRRKREDNFHKGELLYMCALISYILTDQTSHLN